MQIKINQTNLFQNQWRNQASASQRPPNLDRRQRIKLSARSSAANQVVSEVWVSKIVFVQAIH